MAYDEALAARIRALPTGEQAVEKKGFGGLMFLIGGNMAVAAASMGDLMVRCAPDDQDRLAALGAQPMEMGSRPMRGWLRVPAELTASDHDLSAWVRAGVDFARTLPPK
ncbi:MAG TPA: TfoX/Sxy family protein [Propioniciclava tarda]|nr:TfoX/Sxy family protein [Propioniciclava tarda]HQA30876.1 TfoX/Sxy family protein [Propioniciclava tarda]HQD60990.1 TfoX/Sxy family protein [Propioniciclava tarda]